MLRTVARIQAKAQPAYVGAAARLGRRMYSSDLPQPLQTSQVEQPTGPVPQAPNRDGTWAPSQRPKTDALKGPRWEQRDVDFQPAPYAAIELIKKEPVRYLHSNVAVCDGGRGAQGHPKVYINLDKPGAHGCLYCGIRYAKEEFKAGIEANKLDNYIG